MIDVLNDNTIEMFRGDTGTLSVTLTGYTLGENDRALFTARTKSGRVIKREAYTIEENQFEIRFESDDTDKVQEEYNEWDLRIYIDAIFDEDLNVIGGTDVTTPHKPMTLHIMRTVSENYSGGGASNAE